MRAGASKPGPVVGLVILFLLLPLSAEGQDPTQSSRTLHGSVRTDDSRLLDQRARVGLYGPSGTLVDEVFTDSMGIFEFRGLRPNNYRLVVSAPGYETTTLEVQVLVFYLRTTLPPITLTPLMPVEAAPAGPAVSAEELQLPASTQKALKKGRAAMEEKHYSEAHKQFVRVTEASPGYSEGHYWMGLSLMALGEWAKARPTLERALELNPHVPETLLALGKVLNQLEQPGRAREVLLEGTEVSPSSAPFWVELSRAEFTLADYTEAVEHAERAQQLSDAPPSEVHLILANALLKLGRYPEAKRSLRRYLEVDPESPSAPKAREVLEKMERAGIPDP